MGGLIALFNVFWAYNICEALILESPDENRYSIGGIYARPWTSINTIDEIVDSIDAQINKKFINANRYIAANNMVSFVHFKIPFIIHLGEQVAVS